MHVFSQEDMVVTPGIREYEFAAAQELGSVKTLQGAFAGKWHQGGDEAGRDTCGISGYGSHGF